MDIKEIVELHNNYLPYNSLSSNENLYDELLHKYIKDDNVNNIALFGGYGSGKSSIIESYTNKHGEIKNCKVSLAKYNTNSEVVEENNNKNEYKNIYEEIIKQIFFSVPKKKIPRSKFNYLYKDVFNVTRIAIIVFIVQLLLLTFSKLTNFSHLIQDKREIVILLYVIVFIICISIIVYRIIDNNYIDSLKLKNVSIDFKLYDENSNVLDKYLSEIIYIFKKTKIKVVFFEDLDRYNDINIFVELRELNKAINLVLKNYKKSVTFVYAIREDIFDNSYDKFKLFDTSISIVPYASVYNAYDILRKEFNNVQKVLNIQINDEILNSLSYYVKEYRAIKAIVNDFVIFYHRINNQSKGLKIPVNCLLYLMVYKNIFTKDFAKIYSHSSIIDKIIEYIKRNDKYNTLNAIYSVCDNGEEIEQEIINNLEFKEYDKIFRSFICRGISEGYLNDSFGDYVSYIFPISISEKDYNFISYVKNNNEDKVLERDYALDEPQKVFNRLHKFDFSDDKILNDTLFEYILSIYKLESQNEKITKLREPLRNNIDFIVRCLEKDEKYKDLFGHIFKWNDCVYLLSICYRNGDKYSLVVNMFVDKDILGLKQIDDELIKHNISIKQVIEKMENEIIFKNIDDKHIVEISVKFDICYKEIPKYGFSNNVLRELYEKNKYEISSENILFFLNKFEENDVQDDDFCLSVSVLQKIPNIKNYMFSVNNNNFIKYFNNVWLKRKYYKEDDDSFLMLKSLLNGHIDLINTMFDKIDVKIKDISKLDSMSKLELLKRNKIEINISNIEYVQFVSSFGYIESKQFINDNIELVSKLEINEKKYRELNKKIIDIIESEDKKIKFLKNIIDSLEDSDIINILKSLNPDLIKELKEKGEMLIDNENEIYSSILEKIEYIEISKKNKSKFMKLKKIL